MIRYGYRGAEDWLFSVKGLRESAALMLESQAGW